VLTDVQIATVVDFITTHEKFKGTIDELNFLIRKHNEYETLETIWNGEELIAYTRYNICGTTVAVIDAIVKPEYRRKQLLKMMLLNGLKRFPQVRFIRYQRQWKKRNDDRIFPIISFLNVKEQYAT
jgi:hypothetical protein